MARADVGVTEPLKRNPRVAVPVDRRRILLLLALAVVAPALSGCVASGDGQLVGEPAPDFELTTLDGDVVNLTTFRGQWLVLDIMATWCGPCKLETAHLKQVQATYGDRIAILSVGADRDEGPVEMRAFRDEYATNWSYAADPAGAVATAYNLRIIPKMVLIDPDGIVRFEGSGEVYPSTLARVIDPGAPAKSPLALPALVALVAGFGSALNPFGARGRAALRAHADAAPAAFAVAGGLALAAAIGAYAASGFLSGRVTNGSLIVGAVLVAGAAYWPAWRRKREAAATDDAAARPRALVAGFDVAYYAAPGLVVALVLALSGSGWLAFALPFAAAIAGAAAALAIEWRRDVDARVGAAGLALVGVGLIAFGALRWATTIS